MIELPSGLWVAEPGWEEDPDAPDLWYSEPVGELAGLREWLFDNQATIRFLDGSQMGWGWINTVFSDYLAAIKETVFAPSPLLEYLRRPR